MKRMILEACVDSVESALAAVNGGATRLELCGNLIIGGTTPGICLFQEIRKYTDIPIHVLIRPRYGDFCYSDLEFQLMMAEVKTFQTMGAEGVVIGVLNSDGSLDEVRMKLLIEEAKNMSVTLHRAFDVCRDPESTLMTAKKIGIHRILTSGQKNHCMEGMDLIAKLVQEAGDDIEIMVGGGVCAEVIRQLQPRTKVKSFHMSGKTILESEMQYRNQEVNMGIAAISEYSLVRTSQKQIQAAVKVLEQIEKAGR